MTRIIGPDPLPGPATTKDTWESIGPDHRIVWVGSNRTLFWRRSTGEYSVWEYRWTGVPVEADPYLPDATSRGTWNDADRKASQPKRGIVGGELLHLGNQLLLHWVPRSDKESRFGLWRLQPTSPTDPVQSLLTQGDWGSVGAEHRLVYLGGGLVLDWWPQGTTQAVYNVWRLNPGARGSQDPLPTFVANGHWSTIGSDHDVVYLGKDRMLVWERARKVHPEEPDKRQTSRYRVFRVDRAVKNFSQLLPNPVLAEGLWYTIYDDGAERHRLTPIGDAELRMIDIVAAANEAERKVRIWPIKNDIPEITGVPGVTLHRAANLLRVAVVPRTLMAAVTGKPENATVGPTIEELADALRLSSPQAFQELLGFAENGPAVKKLYGQVFETAAYPGLVQARRRLATKGRDAVGSERYGYLSKNQFRVWRVDPNLTLVLSLSAGFRTEVMEAGAKKQEAELRLKMAQPHFDALKTKVEALELALVPLKLNTNLLATSLESAYEDLGLLNALDALLGFMTGRPKAGSSFDAAKVGQLEAQVEALIKAHIEHTILDPKHLQDTKKARDGAADQVLKLLEDPAMLADLQVFVDNVELTKTSLEGLVLDTLRNAYELLLVSNHADHVLEEHVRPAVMQAASLLKLTDLKSGNPDFDAVLAEDIPPPSKASALSVLASRTAPIGTAVGNVPGPSTLAVVIFHLAAPLIARGLGTSVAINRFGGYALRALCACAKFSPAQRLDVMTVVAKGDLALTRKIDWTKSFMNGPVATAGIGLLNLVTLLAAITADEANTKKKVANIVGSAAAFGATSTQFAQAFIRAMNVGRLGTVAGVGSKSLGALSGFVAAGLGAVQAMEERESGDDLGFWLAAVGAGAAYASAAGFLIGGGLAASSTGIGAPAGAVLMGVGIVVGLGAGLVQVWRDIFTNATHSVVEAMVLQYSRADESLIKKGDPIKKGYGAYAFAHDKPGAGPLKAAFEAVQKGHHPGVTGFMPFVAPDPRADDPETVLGKPGLKDGGIELLYDAGFDLHAIEVIVDDTKTTTVLTRLLERRDWPLRRNKQK